MSSKYVVAVKKNGFIVSICYIIVSLTYVINCICLQLDNMQESRKKERSEVIEAQEEVQNKTEENERLQNTITTIKANSERQSSELQVSVCAKFFHFYKDSYTY